MLWKMDIIHVFPASYISGLVHFLKLLKQKFENWVKDGWECNLMFIPLNLVWNQIRKKKFLFLKAIFPSPLRLILPSFLQYKNVRGMKWDDFKGYDDKCRTQFCLDLIIVSQITVNTAHILYLPNLKYH